MSTDRPPNESGQQEHSAPAVEQPTASSEESSMLPEAEKLRQYIVNYVDRNDLKELFWGLYSPFRPVDEVLCIEAATMLKNMDDNSKYAVVHCLVALVSEARSEECATSEMYERVVDTILTYLISEDILPCGIGLVAIIHTSDSSLKTATSAEKWKFVADNWEKLDMKSIRIIFKTLIEWQKGLPAHLSCTQRRQLIPVEDLMLSILTTVPPIFTMTELYQNKGDVYLHHFPRVVEKLAEIKAYFRPMADLVFVVGRSLMYPILAHPQFIASSASWKVDRNRTMLLYSRLQYLPNKKEVSSEQTYLFYMVFKQPRGKDALLQMLRSCDRVALGRVFEQLLSLLISETMAAVEDLKPDEEIPRFMWDHLVTVIVYAAHHDITSTTGVVQILKAILARRQYRRARDEVMWLMLQIAGTFNQNLTKDQIEQMASLYKLLYTEDTSYTVATDHPLQMVRFLSTACMYVLLDGKEGLPQPTESLASQIDFIRGLSSREMNDPPMMAVVANAFRSEHVRRVLVHYSSDLEGNPTEEPFFLSYNRPCNNRLKPLSIQLIDSLAMRVKLHMVTMFNGLVIKQRDRLPSPAFLDTYARIFYTMDFDYGLKSFSQTLSKAVGGITNMNGSDFAKDTLYLVLDLFANRLTNIWYPINFRQTISLTVISIMNLLNNAQPSQSQYLNLDLHYTCEQALIRMFSWTPVNEVIPFSVQLLGKGADRSISMHVCNPNMFSNPPPNADSKSTFHVCPEVVRILFIAIFRTAKILTLDFSDELFQFLKHICTVFKWAPSQVRSFPPICKNMNMIDETTNCNIQPEMLTTIHADFMQMRGLPEASFLDYMSATERKPTLLCVIFRAMFENEDRQMYPTFYQLLTKLTSRQTSLCLNWLSDYVIHEVSERISVSGPDAPIPVIGVLKAMIFQKYVLTLDRFLLAMILHTTNDAKAQIALIIIKNIMESQEMTERITYYCHNVPRKETHPTEFFEALPLYHKKFPEFSYQEMYAAGNQGEPQINTKCHPPTYYGSLIERLLPIADIVLGRALETELIDMYMSPLLKCLSPIYKYHPSPISFVYTILHSQHEVLGHLLRARHFVISIFSQRDDMQLTERFVRYNHQNMSSLEDLLTDLITRLVECSEFIIKPPPYVTQDWRMSELAPAAQALYLSCIELMASPHTPSALVPAMVSLLCGSPLARSRPYTTLNAIALLLTALPLAYAKQLQDMFADVLDQHAVNNLTFEELVFDNFEESVLLHMTNKPMIINSMLQAYWHHGNTLSISTFTSFFLDTIYKKITTEKELWYFIRLMVPLQQWVFEAKMKHNYTECISQARGLLKKTGELAEAGVDFEHGEELCDLFYHLKYMCVGDALTQEAEEIIPKLPLRMRERFKYYTRGSKGDDDPAPKISSVIRPDVSKLFKTDSDASERAETSNLRRDGH